MGRHGGINILHQKSWHVWRMDNRLRVERDELRHEGQEREKRRAEQQEVFNEKLRRMRRRAAGGEVEDAHREAPEGEPRLSNPSSGVEEVSELSLSSTAPDGVVENTSTSSRMWRTRRPVRGLSTKSCSAGSA